jgi:hypothetical protein
MAVSSLIIDAVSGRRSVGSHTGLRTLILIMRRNAEKGRRQLYAWPYALTERNLAAHWAYQVGSHATDYGASWIVASKLKDMRLPKLG